ncbi:hypothetical protein HAX54_047184, partial [Datura stramonium]|nr:hypothetical protein [Datura stramonium]
MEVPICCGGLAVVNPSFYNQPYLRLYQVCGQPVSSDTLSRRLRVYCMRGGSIMQDVAEK